MPGPRKNAASIENNLLHIGHLNRLLADELAKLPEIKKFKTDSARLALDNLLSIYRFSPDRFNHMFARMCTIGLPVHRHNCSPLQAMFWMIQDERLEDSGRLLGLNIVKSTDANGNCQPLLHAKPDIAMDKNDSTHTNQSGSERVCDARQAAHRSAATELYHG